ncbi:hypothetical protein B0H34DRAFT_8826 [Crassisporium funariophilum]|nr:hypothetical protein B0H34DRAFT_8826 [Crassisporium funariophilum]
MLCILPNALLIFVLPVFFSCTRTACLPRKSPGNPLVPEPHISPQSDHILLFLDIDLWRTPSTNMPFILIITTVITQRYMDTVLNPRS